jgi:hypothetical protein
MEQWGDVGQVFDGNGGARLPESVDDSGNLEPVPYQDGVGYQAQAARLIHDLLVIPGAEFSLVGEEDPACQTVPMLTPIQLQLVPLS